MNTPLKPQLHKHSVRQCACPKCKGKQLTLVELWKNHSINFDYDSGKIIGDGNLEVGAPYKVEANCNKCNHRWTLKGVKQITDIVQHIA